MNTPSKESSYGTLEREPGSGHELNETPGKKIFNSFETKDVKTKDGIIKCYTIPAEIKLYHGSNTVKLKNGKPDFREGLHTFFALSEEYAAKYAKKNEKNGNVFMFETIAPIELVAMDKPNNGLYNKVTPEMKTILEKNYGFPDNHKRMSEPENDNALSQYLCDNGFNGYAAGEMKGVNLTYDLDPEIVLCNINRLKYIGSKNVGSHDEAPRIQDKCRKPRRIYDGPGSSDKNNVSFGNGDDNNDNIFPSRFTGNLDFGNKTPGGKKKKLQKETNQKKHLKINKPKKDM